MHCSGGFCCVEGMSLHNKTLLCGVVTLPSCTCCCAVVEALSNPLPPNLQILQVGPGIVDLPPLPASIIGLMLDGSELRHLPELPTGLQELECSSCTGLGGLPTLPPKLTMLSLYNCEFIEQLPTLPETLQHLNLAGCRRLLQVPDLSHCNKLKRLHIQRCNALQELCFGRRLKITLRDDRDIGF